jgi:hypothetical protein
MLNHDFNGGGIYRRHFLIYLYFLLILLNICLTSRFCDDNISRYAAQLGLSALCHRKLARFDLGGAICTRL